MSAQAETTGPLFTLRAETLGQVLRVWLLGELSQRTAIECERDLKDPLLGPEPIVVVDVGGLSAIDASGIAVLSDIKRLVEADGRRLLLASVPVSVAETLAATVPGQQFEVLDGALPAQKRCDICDGPLPAGLHLCPRCGAVL